MNMKRRAMFSAPFVVAGAVAAVVSGKATAKTTELTSLKLEVDTTEFKKMIDHLMVYGQSNSNGVPPPCQRIFNVDSEQRDIYYANEAKIMNRARLREFAVELSVDGETLQEHHVLHNYELIHEAVIS